LEWRQFDSKFCRPGEISDGECCNVDTANRLSRAGHVIEHD